MSLRVRPSMVNECWGRQMAKVNSAWPNSHPALPEQSIDGGFMIFMRRFDEP